MSDTTPVVPYAQADIDKESWSQGGVGWIVCLRDLEANS